MVGLYNDCEINSSALNGVEETWLKPQFQIKETIYAVIAANENRT